MPTLRVLSDLHLECDAFEATPARPDEIVVLAGDIASPGVAAVVWALHPRVFGRASAVVYVPGHSEHHGATASVAPALMREASVGSNLHVLDGDELVLAGTRFLGCTLHPQQQPWLTAALREPFGGPTVVVTHRAPHRDSLARGAFFPALDDAFSEVPWLWVHGQLHASVDYRAHGCRVVCNPRGYPSGSGHASENAEFDPEFAVALPD